MSETLIKDKQEFSYIRSTLIPFIKENGDRRIGKNLIEHYKLFSIQKNSIDEIIIVEETSSNTLASISVATIRNNSHITFSTTVTAKEYRGQGLGAKVLAEKIKILKERDMGIKTTVADDNLAGLRICEKVGLKQVEKRQKVRATGPYNSVILIDPPKSIKENIII